jgi:putative transposase
LSERRALVSGEAELSIRRQCKLLSLNRSTAYYEAAPAPVEDLGLMRLIDELYTARPIYGSRKMRERLREIGHVVNRKRVQRLMRLTGLEGLQPRRSTSKPHPGHKTYPYLLRGVEVVRANQVWSTDITYIPMAHGFVYCVAIVDWYSRMVLSWRVSNTMHTSFCVNALEEALRRWGTPEIFNSDQGAQFTDGDFIAVLERSGARISMGGNGRWRDNVFVERLWRSLKYEEVYLRAYDEVVDARRGIGDYFAFFNEERPHQALGYSVPSAVYFSSLAESVGKAA